LNIADFDKANQLAQQLDINKLHRKLDKFVTQYCPVIKTLMTTYHWSIMQAELATDIIFKRQKDLQAIYNLLLLVIIYSVRPENIASFLGQKLHGNYKGEMGNRFNVRILGTRILHLMGPVAIKMYDKFGIILRIETTVNDVSFFKDAAMVRVLLRGEFMISGFTARQLRPLFPGKNAGQISRLIKRLRVHGLIKKIGRTYKYYLTQAGRQVAVIALKLRELYVIPALAQATAA
jgi:hypothetical protein